LPHVIEPAVTARAKCRGCGEPIPAGEMRFGERLPNPFADGETTHWYHLDCAAFKRPAPFLEALEARTEPPDGSERLEAEAKRGLAHRRLPRVDGVSRSPSGRAQCRSCREAIPKGDWRIGLVFWEEGRFSPAGYIHVRCSRAYFETADVLPRLRHFTRDLRDQDLVELQAELDRAAPTPSSSPDPTSPPPPSPAPPSPPPRRAS
jgi:hypothetical protein